MAVVLTIFMDCGGVAYDGKLVGKSRISAAVPLLILERWLHPFGFVVSLAFTLAYAYPVIILDR